MAVTKEKLARLAMAYGAGDVNVARTLGYYPPRDLLVVVPDASRPLSGVSPHFIVVDDIQGDQ